MRLTTPEAVLIMLTGSGVTIKGVSGAPFSACSTGYFCLTDGGSEEYLNPAAAPGASDTADLLIASKHTPALCGITR